MSVKLPHILIIGGGAAGLELATRLGNQLGRQHLTRISLVDQNLKHVWKPLWHEVAAGTFSSSDNEIDYLEHGYRHGFEFRLGSLGNLNRQDKIVSLAPVYIDGQEVLPERH